MTPPKEDIFFNWPPPLHVFLKSHTHTPPVIFWRHITPPPIFLSSYTPPPIFSGVTKIVRLSLYVPKEDIGPTPPTPVLFSSSYPPPPVFFVFLPPPPLYLFVFLPPPPPHPTPIFFRLPTPPPILHQPNPPPVFFRQLPPPGMLVFRVT